MKTEFSLVTGLALVLVVVMAASPGPAAAQGKDPTKTTTKADAAAVQSQPGMTHDPVRSPQRHFAGQQGEDRVPPQTRTEWAEWAE